MHDGEKEIATVTLKDFDGSGRAVKVKITEGPCGIAFRPEGYGDVMESTGGIPAMLEFYEGKLRVIIWDDINYEDHSHAISLEGAREELRKPANDCDGS